VDASRTRRVSFDDEPLILVDEENNVVGHGSKADVHAGQGLLHRAFSVFLFDDEGCVLLQQRSASKPLWPLWWSNSCCSHPRRGETEAEAAQRRVHEELGLDADLEYVYTFTYHARYEDKGSEHETCSVFLARATGRVVTNQNEIAAVRWVAAAEIDRSIVAAPGTLTPWLEMEWARLRSEFAATLARYTGA
jgi:isopentenyl-diphosphate delta-isomerase